MSSYFPQPSAPRSYKDTAIAYVLWFILGNAGFHRFYLGHIGMGILHIALFYGGALLTSTVIGAIIGIPMMVAWFILWLVEAFLLAGYVNAHNLRTAQINSSFGAY